jgi:hypothetical protein
MTEAEREKYVAWWLYESGLSVAELVGSRSGCPRWRNSDGRLGSQ